MPKRRGTLDGAAKDPDADTISITSETLSPIVDTEPIPLDIELWSTLVRQLEDLICIDSLLRLKPSKIRRVHSSEELTVSISTLLEGGKGL